MNWFKDVALLFGEWLLIMLIPLVIGIVIGWLLWYRKWRKVETEKASITKELNNCRTEKESITLRHSEEMQSLKLMLVKSRKEADEKLSAKTTQIDKWKADYEECHLDNEALDLGYKEDIIKLKERIVALEAEQEAGNNEHTLKLDALNTDLIALKASEEELKAQAQGTDDIERLTIELSKSKEENHRLAQALVLAEKVQDTLEDCEAKTAKLQGELDASSSLVRQLEAELNDAKASADGLDVQILDYKTTVKELEADLETCKAEKEILISASGEQMALDIGMPEEMTKQDAEIAFTKHLEEASKGIELNYEDDLKEISGVGPKMEKMLKEFGVQTFYQLSKFDEEGVAALNAKLDGFAGRIQRDNWVGQAFELHDKHHNN